MTSTQRRRFGDGAEVAESALGPVCVGGFGYEPGAQMVWWSRRSAPRTAEALAAGDGRMSVEELLGLVHAQDRAPLAEALAGGVRFCLRVRLPDSAGGERTLILLVDQAVGETGPGVVVEGIYIDLTDALDVRAQALVDEMLPSMVAAGAVIEQAVGMLRLVYGVTADKARELLVWRAGETGVTVPEFATLLCTAVAQDAAAAPAPVRARVDNLLLSVHQRAAEA